MEYRVYYVESRRDMHHCNGVRNVKAANRCDAARKVERVTRNMSRVVTGVEESEYRQKEPAR